MTNDFFDNPPDSHQSSPAGTMPDMDAMFERVVDQDVVRKIEADSLRPVGTYTTETLTLNVDIEGELDYNGNPNPRKGRTVFRYNGKATMIVDEKNAPSLELPPGTLVSGYFTVRMSPDRYNWDDGSPDTQSKLWANAVKAYKLAVGHATPSVRQVVDYVRDYPVRLRVIQKNTKEDAKGEPRNDVVAISAVREPK